METNCKKSDENECNKCEVDLKLSSDSETNCHNKETIEAIVDNNSDSMQSMSKKQLKRLLRNKKWLESRPERRRQEKEKKKLKLKYLREEGIEVKRSVRRSQMIPMSSSDCKVCVCIDCDFEEYMNENEMKKLVKQIGRCYALNRHSSSPVQLYITSITSKIKEMFVRCQSGFVNWDAVCSESHWTQVFANRDKIVYMSSDSEQVIPEPKHIRLKNDYIFVIGGLVDHNRHKGLCHRLATEKDVSTGRLPIDEYIEMSQRRVLAVNHVFEIMLMASNGSSDSWTQIFNNVIPLRKLKQ